MARQLALLMVATLAAVPALASSWTDQFFSQVDHDFGTVKRGTVMSHAFVLENRSRRDVRIKKVSVSCGCVKASAGSMVVPTGGSTVIDATMDTSGFVGHKSVTITVQFERPWRTEASLRVHAQIIGSGLTQEIDFGVIGLASGAEKKIGLENPTRPGWEVVAAETMNPHLDVNVGPASRDKGHARFPLTVSLKPSAPVGNLQDYITVKTNDPANPTVQVLVKATIEGLLTATPDAFRLDNAAAGSTISRTILVKAPKPFTIIRVENTAGLFSVKSAPTPKTVQMLVLTMSVPTEESQIPDHLEVFTSESPEKPLSLPIIR